MTAQNPVAERLAAALARRHWEPAVVAQATGVPEATVRRHLAGETPISTSELQRYAGVLGLDSDALLADAALTGVTTDHPQPTLLAAQRLLHEVWADADPADRRDVMDCLQRHHKDATPETRKVAPALPPGAVE